jgi:hypothetical protein
MTTAIKPVRRVERNGHLRWVAVSDIHVNPRAQRDLRPGWAAQIANDFDPDRFSPPLLSLRDDKYYVIDGQHRVEAIHLMGWDDQQIQCHVYEDLNEASEADLFLWHNTRKAVSAFDKFQIAVVAGRDEEADINRIVLANGLKVAHGLPGSISAVTALRRTYAHGPKVLARTLCIIRDSYGDDGLQGNVIEGIGLVCARYNGELDFGHAVQRLSGARGGLGALMSKAYSYRKQLGKPIPHCVAGAAVELINAGRGGRKLPGWWAA